jgi:hypothetical protein
MTLTAPAVAKPKPTSLARFVPILGRLPLTARAACARSKPDDVSPFETITERRIR